MTALTKDRNTTQKVGGQVAYGVAASAKIYAGALVCLNGSGYAVPAADTAGLRFVGVAQEQVDNAGGANGAKTVLIKDEGVFDFSGANFTAADVGKAVFASDDQTVALSTTNGIGVGHIREVESATKVWVEIDDHPAAAQASVASADAPAQSGVYVQADVQAIATLANETKSVVNGLLAKLRAAGIIGS